MAEVPQDILDWRKRTGADRYDEMWEGVLHMPPMPNREHQNFVWALETWLRVNWARSGRGRLFHEINVASIGGWPKNYRVLDVLILKPDRYQIDRNEYFEGGPTVAVEVVSPGDESYDKFDFYGAIGTPEVWTIQRDSRTPEMWLLHEGTYRRQEPNAAGWLCSPETEVQMCASDDRRLMIRLGQDEGTLELLP